ILILILIIMAIVAYYISFDEEDEETPIEPEMKMFEVVWTNKTMEMPEIIGSAETEYNEPFTVTAPYGCVLTSVDVEIDWEDDNTIRPRLGNIFPRLEGGKDTLTANIILEGGETRTHESTGSGNEKFTFDINDEPMDDIIEAEDYDQANEIISEMYSDETDANFDVDVSVENGEMRIIRFIRRWLDKGDDFTLKITYEYYEYDIIESETLEESEDIEEESMTSMSMLIIKNLSSGKGWA
ncbi:MAG: hypothetical protein JSW62_01840, partial [Thermoplasmatales archaeon]